MPTDYRRKIEGKFEMGFGRMCATRFFFFFLGAGLLCCATILNCHTLAVPPGRRNAHWYPTLTRGDP